MNSGAPIGMVGIINAMIAAVFAALLAVLVGASTAIAVGVGALVLVAAFGVQMAFGLSIDERLRDGLTFHSPSAADELDLTSAGSRTRGQGRRTAEIG